MGERLYLSGQAAKILGIEKRQVLSRTEKGIITPFKESTGTGSWNELDYINLLELSLSETLFSIGFGFRAVRGMVKIVTTTGYIRAWASNFKDHYENEVEEMREKMRGWLLEVKDDPKKVEAWNQLWAEIQEPLQPKMPAGVLVYSFKGRGVSDVKIYPFRKDRVFKLTEIKDTFMEDRVSILVDIGKIKHELDQRL